jgi:hypothetical protein
LIRIKAALPLFSDPAPSNSGKGCIMGTGEILFLVLVLAAASVFAVTLAYYSKD